MHEAQNTELAAQLLDVVNEAELEDFLRKLAKKTLRTIGRPLSGAAQRALMGELRRTAERTLPALSVAREGMSPEDRDFEIARQFVRFAQSATARAAGVAAPRPQTSNGG